MNQKDEQQIRLLILKTVDDPSSVAGYTGVLGSDQIADLADRTAKDVEPVLRRTATGSTCPSPCSLRQGRARWSN
ncbi:MAG: hypothetical protein NVSMB55_00700 [Mycobacteriales bacterium]